MDTQVDKAQFNKALGLLYGTIDGRGKIYLGNEIDFTEKAVVQAFAKAFEADQPDIPQSAQDNILKTQVADYYNEIQKDTPKEQQAEMLYAFIMGC